MNTLIKKFNILTLTSLVFLLASSCDNDKKEDEPTKPAEVSNYSNIDGIIYTGATININNTLQAVIKSDKEKINDEVVGSTNVKDNQFSLPLNTPKHLSSIMSEDIAAYMSIDNPNAQIAVMEFLQLINGETYPVDFVSCSSKSPIMDLDKDVLEFEDLIIHVYTDRNVKIKGSFSNVVKGCKAKNKKTTMNLYLKKGWNVILMKNTTNDTIAEIELTSLPNIPDNYKWYLSSDFYLDEDFHGKAYKLKKPIIPFKWSK